jgi:hypothetical protein
MKPTKASEFTLREQESADVAPLLTRCVFCGWIYLGTAAEGRNEAREHRLQAHPEVRAKRPITRSLSSFRQRELTAEQQADIDEERRKRAILLGLEI